MIGDSKHDHVWQTIEEVNGDEGLLGIVTNLLFGGFTHYIVQKCTKCGAIKKISL